MGIPSTGMWFLIVVGELVAHPVTKMKLVELEWEQVPGTIGDAHDADIQAKQLAKVTGKSVYILNVRYIAEHTPITELPSYTKAVI